jgi:hypothetical protein
MIIMLTSKQKVFKKIYMRYLDKLGKASSYFNFNVRIKAAQEAEEDKRLHLLALNSIM